ILENVEISENGYLAFISEDGSMSFKNVEDKYMLDADSLIQLAKSNEYSGKQKSINTYGTKMMVVYDTLDTNGWKLAAVFPENELIHTIGFIKYATAIIMIVLIFVSVILSNMLARIVTEPLSQLIGKVKKVEEGNLDVVFDVNAENEIGKLGKGITKMMERVKGLIEQVEFESNQKRQAEFAALQAQIKPHFLYNTLYAIKQLCKMNEMEDAVIMVSALATFFRISVSKGEEIITVKDEISHVENYLIIQHMRYKDKLKYSINIDEDLYCYSVVKLMLQPIVENAIYHGINNKRGIGTINIKGYIEYIEGKDLTFEIKDDGIGIKPEKINEITNLLQSKERNIDSLGMGLFNVHERIRIMFGQEYGIKIESEFQVGTTVYIRIPAIKTQK
ncbi:MAG: histidine kinase, partial [Clostridiaceae bacterium]|nr:histidine kinase [Clostridiaceae bacterium]